MLFSDLGEQPEPGHTGFFAGRYRDGAYSDAWTDVFRCAEGTFVGYAVACTCGWRGAPQSGSPVGRAVTSAAWHQHLAQVRASANTPARQRTCGPADGGDAPSTLDREEGVTVTGGEPAAQRLRQNPNRLPRSPRRAGRPAGSAAASASLT